MAFCGNPSTCDARGLHSGCYSSWLMKVKGDGARARWMSSASKRYFTIDYDSQLFYYSHSEDRKKISNPIRFKEILDANQLPRPSQAPFKGLSSRTKKDSNEFTFGFVVQTPGRNYELFTNSNLEAQYWVAGLIAGRDIANGVHTSQQPTQVGNNYLATSSKTPIQNSSREPSRSSLSTTADGGSDSGRSSEQDLSRYNGPTTTTVPGPPPGPQPRNNAFSGGYGTQTPPVAGNYSAPFSGGSAPSSGYGGLGVGSMQNAPPISQSKSPPVANGGGFSTLQSSHPPVPARTFLQSPEVSMMPPTGGDQEVDPFAALDALEELAGPLPTQAPSSFETAPRQNQNISGALLREARNIVTNKSKPSAEANEALQRLKSNPAVDDGQSGSSYMQQRPLAQQQPLAPLAPPTQTFTESPPAFAQVQHQPVHHRPLQQQPLQHQPPQQQSLQHQPMQHQPIQQFAQQQAVQQQHQPTQAVSAMTYHNPSAESWDSDEDESPSIGLRQSVAPAPLAPAPLQQSSASKTPPIVNGWTAPTTAHVTAPPAKQVKQVDPLASGWDSDDDDVPVKQQAVRQPLHHQQPLHQQQAVPPPLHHQQATSSTAVDGLSDNDWDEDDTAPLKAPAKATRAAPKPLGRDPCGAPMQPTEAFVTASRPPAKVVEKHKSGSDDDLDDLVGEVLAASRTTAPKTKASTHGLVPGFQCTGCDFQVLRIDDCIWGSGVEYMFFRNNYPNVQKMRPQLVPRKDCCAYCCQCSWKSAEIAAPLEDVAAGLRWRKIA